MTNWLDITDKVVVITGGSSGIGRKIVESLLENEAIVYNADMKDSPLDHKRYHYLETDVTQEENVKASVEQIVSEQNKIRSEEHTSELQSRFDLVCRLLLE